MMLQQNVNFNFNQGFDDNDFQDPMPHEDGFQRSVIEHNGNDDLFDNFGSQMLIMGDDLNKMHKNFAGDTFSQISSTYEQQMNMLSNQPNQPN
jgi:hypothetical protein